MKAFAWMTVLALAGPLTARAEKEGKDEKELPASVVFARLAPSVVVVETTLKGGKKQGSGVVVDREQIVTTTPWSTELH